MEFHPKSRLSIFPFSLSTPRPASRRIFVLPSAEKEEKEMKIFSSPFGQGQTVHCWLPRTGKKERWMEEKRKEKGEREWASTIHTYLLLFPLFLSSAASKPRMAGDKTRGGESQNWWASSDWGVSGIPPQERNRISPCTKMSFSLYFLFFLFFLYSMHWTFFSLGSLPRSM